MPHAAERRRDRRVGTPGGEAFCHVGGRGDRYELTDLSSGGAGLRSGPLLPTGQRIGIVLFAGGIGMVQLDAHVVRQTPRRATMSICFEPADHEAERRLHDLIATATEHDLRPRRYEH